MIYVFLGCDLVVIVMILDLDLFLVWLGYCNDLYWLVGELV